MDDTNTRSLSMIKKLSEARGAPGFEDEVVAVLRREAEGLGELAEDSLRNVYISRARGNGAKPVIQLDAHSDEVAFMVQAIRPNGTLAFIKLGTWVDYTIPAHRVLVRNARGEYIPGIVATKPPHYMSEEERRSPLSAEAMVIDVGASSAKQAVEDFALRIGEPIVPDVSFEYDQARDLMLGKAFDCRLGCAAVIDTMRRLAGRELAVDIVGAIAVQEEMGLRGATVTANRVKPDIAIVFEGCPADDTFAENYMIQTAIKRGPMLRHIDARMISNPRFQRYALDLGEKLGIPLQSAVRSGGSTNGASIHLSNLGVPVIVIGLPVRYIHTHYGFASLGDYRAAVALASAIIERLDEKTIRGF